MTDTRTFRVVDEDGDYYETTGDPMDALNAAYRERAHLVALLAAVYPSHIGRTDPSAPDWAVVTLQLPTGQAAWHISADDEDLFQHVEHDPEHAFGYDGHSTEEKYARIRTLTAEIAEAQEATETDVMVVPALVCNSRLHPDFAGGEDVRCELPDSHAWHRSGERTWTP